MVRSLRTHSNLDNAIRERLAQVQDRPGLCGEGETLRLTLDAVDLVLGNDLGDPRSSTEQYPNRLS
jgi:hypothetical protein